jgi:hypothetical protein
LWITDFGLAQVQSDTRLTLTGDLVGTLRYMSPEQAQGSRAVDHRSDVYSLGVTLYELLTLEPAFRGQDRQELLRQVVTEEPRPPRRINRAVPAELETVVLKAMGKEPQERYATAQELANDLRRWLEDKPIQAKRPSLRQRAVKLTRRHPGVSLTLAVSALVILLLGVIGLAVNNQLLRQEQARTEAARQDEATARQAESKRRVMVRQALDALSSDVIDEWLAAQKQLLPKHREFLRRTLAWYEELAADTGEDMLSRGGVAVAHAQIAKMRNLLGETADAEVAYGRAIQLLGQLAADFPNFLNVPLVRSNLAAAHPGHSQISGRSGREICPVFQGVDHLVKVALIRRVGVNCRV